MDDPLASSRYSIEHAKRHIGQFKTEVTAFMGSDPYTRVVETNADRTEDTHKLKLTKPMPVALPGIAFDAITNLRSSLDQAGYAVALAANRSGRDAHFPFADKSTEIQSRLRGGSKDIPKEVFDVMVSFEPYEGGKGFLWPLNKLCNTNKHEIILPIALATGDMTLNAFFPHITSAAWPPQWDVTKQEMELARVLHGATPDYHFRIELLIVIGEVKGVARQPAFGVLDAMLREVESVIVAVEAEARRLGLFK